MKFETFLDICLKDPEFKKYWEEDLKNLDDTFFSENKEDGLSISEALSLLEEEDLQDIITNKGIKKNIKYSTDIIFFEFDTKCPVADFLNSIENKKLKEKTVLNIAELAIKGNDARPPLSRYLRDGIFELRTKHGKDITRIFYFFVFGNKIILTNGHIKKQQKLDEKEFKRAKKYMDMYLKRNTSEEKDD